MLIVTSINDWRVRFGGGMQIGKGLSVETKLSVYGRVMVLALNVSLFTVSYGMNCKHEL